MHKILGIVPGILNVLHKGLWEATITQFLVGPEAGEVVQERGLKWERKWNCDDHWFRTFGHITLCELFFCRCDQTPRPRQLTERRVFIEFTVPESIVAREASPAARGRRADRSRKLSHHHRKQETETSNSKLAPSEVLPSAKWHFSNLLRQCHRLGAKWLKSLAYVCMWEGGGEYFLFKPPHTLITQRH